MKSRIPLALGGALVVVLAGLFLLARRAESNVNHVALRALPKQVTAVRAERGSFRDRRAYVGTIEPWVEAKVGPQLVSAYVDTVLVRPGAVVQRGQVVATLDCRNASAESRAIAMQARALDAEQKAIADEASRVQGLLRGGFVSPNEAERKVAASAARQAEVLATRAKLLGSSLGVGDCVLRAPFDGEIADRNMDPGMFAHPGSAVVTVLDRSTVRIVADAPEADFGAIAPGTEVKVHAIATDRELSTRISRRAPAADTSTRTVHFEIDVPASSRDLPVGTTADLHIDIGEPRDAVIVPLYAATVRGERATLFVVKQGVAHERVATVRGEREGKLFLEPLIEADAEVVTEGRSLLKDNDRVTPEVEGAPRALAPEAAAHREVE